jgi:hypothetical protein
VSRFSSWWPAGTVLALLTLGEWVALPALPWVGAAVLAALGTVVLLLPRRGWVFRALIAGLLAAAAALPALQWRLDRIAGQWPEERERRITAASRRLAGDLDAAFDRVEAVSERARDLPAGPRGDAFTALAGLLPSGETEVGVVLLEPTGVPWAWAGSHHRIPEAGGPGISSRVDGYYLLLESRRRATDGRVAVASALVWAHPAAPGQERSIAERFRRRTGVALAIFAPGTAPDDPDVFDYDYADASSPTGRRLLFSVRLEPPEQDAALAGAGAGARTTAVALGAAILLLAFIAAPAPGRVALTALAPWLIYRAAEGRGVEGSLPAALAAGAALVLLAAVIARRGAPRRALAGACSSWPHPRSSCCCTARCPHRARSPVVGRGWRGTWPWLCRPRRPCSLVPSWPGPRAWPARPAGRLALRGQLAAGRGGATRRARRLVRGAGGARPPRPAVRAAPCRGRDRERRRRDADLGGAAGGAAFPRGGGPGRPRGEPGGEARSRARAGAGGHGATARAGHRH